MERKIFYSWQSHSEQRVNRYLIRDALEAAKKQLAFPCEIDEATRGVPGSPPIFETILKKIDRAAVFVSDLTLTQMGDGSRSTCNPNVLVEYGYALAKCGDGKILTVINQSFGDASQLPFDLRHKSVSVVYSLAPDSEKDEIKKCKKLLTGLFVSRLRLLLEDPGSVLGLSEVEVGIVEHVLKNDTSARGQETLTSKKLAEDLGLDIGLVKNALADLMSRGYVKELPVVGPSPPIEALPRMYWDCDIYVHGWDPRADALEVAKDLVKSSDSGNGSIQLLRYLDSSPWSLRRLNPALHYLTNAHIVRGDNTVSPKTVVLSIYENELTRKFIRGDYNPERRRRS